MAARRLFPDHLRRRYPFLRGEDTNQLFRMVRDLGKSGTLPLARGVARLEQDLLAGPIAALSLYTFVWGTTAPDMS